MLDRRGCLFITEGSFDQVQSEPSQKIHKLNFWLKTKEIRYGGFKKKVQLSRIIKGKMQVEQVSKIALQIVARVPNVGDDVVIQRDDKKIVKRTRS
jgi:hypothetical protein